MVTVPAGKGTQEAQ
jgi:hypothetical protein